MLTLTEAIDREAQRVETFATMAETPSRSMEHAARRYAYRSHVAYLAMARLERQGNAER